MAHTTDLEAVRAYREQHAAEIVRELAAFVSVPNNMNNVADIERNAQTLKGMLERRGISAEIWPTPTGRPFVYGELATPGAQTTVLFYGHYDGVPVEPAQWHSDPYQPVLRTHMPAGAQADWSTQPLPERGPVDPSWRLFGRSVADSKNAIVAILIGLDALRATGQAPKVNLKFLFDGEEEQESPSLAACFAERQARLAADLMISASGETHQSGRPTMAFGLRGMVLFSLTVYTMALDLHSGHFGNFAPNAAFGLAHLLSALKDPNGNVLVEGFYDDVVPLTDSERAAVEAIPQIEARVQEHFGIARPEVAGELLQMLINRPTLNVRGVNSGFVGQEARNIVPHTAVAEFDVRLVKGMDPDRTRERIVAHIERQGWTVVEHEPTIEELRQNPRLVRLKRHAGFPATRIPLDTPIAGRLVRAVRRAVSDPLVLEPTDGGSLPLFFFEQAGIPLVSLPTSNYDCNQHTSDENLHLRYFFQGVDIFASVLLWE